MYNSLINKLNKTGPRMRSPESVMDHWFNLTIPKTFPSSQLFEIKKTFEKNISEFEKVTENLCKVLFHYNVWLYHSDCFRYVKRVIRTR